MSDRLNVNIAVHCNRHQLTLEIEAATDYDVDGDDWFWIQLGSKAGFSPDVDLYLSTEQLSELVSLGSAALQDADVDYEAPILAAEAATLAEAAEAVSRAKKADAELADELLRDSALDALSFEAAKAELVTKSNAARAELRCDCGHPEDTGSPDHAPDCAFVLGEEFLSNRLADDIDELVAERDAEAEADEQAAAIDDDPSVGESRGVSR